MDLHKMLLWMVVTLSLVAGVTYARIDRGVDPTTVVKHVDVCVKMLRFRYVYQGEKLVTMFQVFEEKNGVSVPSACNFGPYSNKEEKQEEKEEG